MHVHETEIAVRYAETDAMGIVHHASYLVWFEVARTEWLLSLGHHYADFERSGFFLVVGEVGVRYLKPARYGDRVLVHTSVSQLRSRSIRFEYTCRHAGSGEQLATGFTHHILTGRDGKIRKWPEEWLKRINPE